MIHFTVMNFRVASSTPPHYRYYVDANAAWRWYCLYIMYWQ